jgi:site-specific recombinase XerD
LKYRGDKKDVNTGLTVLPENWMGGHVLPKAKKATTINQQLQEITHQCRTIFEKLKTTFGDFTLNELVEKLKGNETPPETLWEYVSGKLQELKQRVEVDLAITTYYKYTRTANYLKQYMDKKMSLKNIPLSRVDQSFLEGFFNYLRREKKNSNNSAVALMNCLKTILHEPVKKGVIRYNPFVTMALSQQPVKRDYLTTEEIKALQRLSGLSEAMERNRDLFLFACFTGLAYSDIVSLESVHIIIDPDGSKHIEKYREKTGILSYVPLLPVAEKILLKYSPTGDCRDFTWRVPSNQKLNFALKEIARLAGIEKILFMHLARHTFATTVTLSNGVPIESVGKMIGHSGMKNLMIYAKIVNSKVKKDMEGVMEVF